MVLIDRRRRVGPAVALAAFLGGVVAGCTGDSGDPPSAAAVTVAQQTPYVPGASWARRRPAESGFDEAALQEAVDWALDHETTMPQDPGRYLRDRFEGQRWQDIVGPTKERGGVNGILLKDGYIVAEWGDTERPDMTFSVTKSYLSTVLGVAWDDGLIPDLDAPVADLITDGGFDSPHNARITWRHHLQQLSEWEGTLFGKPDQADRRRGVDRELQEPGTFWEYNDVRVNRIALSALRLFQAPLPDVLRREIMDPIGASDTWEWNGYETSWVEVDGDSVQSVSGGGHWGGGLVISTRDHARFGLLMLREGVWGDDRLLSKEWIDQALTPSIQANYGFMWWLNTEREQFSNAPESSFFALGAGSTSTIWVDPDHDIVLVSRWVDGPDVNELIGRILAAYDGGAPAEGVGGAPLGEGFDAAEGFAVGFGPSFKRVFSDEPTGFGGHYDDRVEIELARNEVEGTQMILFPTEDVAGVAVRVEPLAGPGDAVISSEDIEIRTVGYVNLIESRSAGGRVGWHPDPLFPNQPVDLKRGVPQSFLVSVRTEVDTPPGDYFGALVIEAAGRSVRRELAVRVWDVVLPETPRFKTANFADWRLPGRMWPVSQGYPELDDEARLSHMLRLADLGFEYRLPPTVFLANGLSSWNEGGRGETTYGFPTHDDDGAGGQVFNPDRTDRLIDYMLERGANHFFLAVTSNVWRHSPDGGRRDRLVAYLNDYRDHLRARGLLDLAYVYNIDEPWNEAVREAKQTYTLIRERVGPDLRVMQNTNQNNPRIVPQLLGFFDVLDINLGFHDVTDVAAYRSLHPGPLGELWWNVNRWPDTHPNLFVEYPLMDARIIGPLSYAYDIDGFEYWGMVWVDGIGNYRPVASDELRVPWEVDAHSLDGTLVYPAEDGEIYPSLRLASLRDGFEDLELLYVLESLNPEHPLLEVPIVQELDRFTRDPAEYLRFRRRVAEAIVATTPDPLRP